MTRDSLIPSSECRREGTFRSSWRLDHKKGLPARNDTSRTTSFRPRTAGQSPRISKSMPLPFVRLAWSPQEAEPDSERALETALPNAKIS
eukprot:4995314-Lingulodinium_polyedra.AAC.1